MKQIVLIVAFLAVPSLSAAAERPNILLIVSEDNGPELSCYGEPSVKTPVLDRLASEGVRFERAFVTQAGCSQSRASYLTGLYPHQNGQIGLATWKFRMYREDTPNIVRSLKQAGYRTGNIGKLHINPESALPFDVLKIHSSNFQRKNLGAYAAEAKKFIEASDGPFFLAVNYPDAHRPFIGRTAGLPDKPLTGDEVKPLAYFGLDTPDLREQTAGHYNCMQRLDALVGDLLGVLWASGKYDDTLIVYMGDHGADLLRGKRTSYEGGARVPMIVRWGSRWQAAKGDRPHVRGELVSTVDLMPTFLDAAGAEPVAGLPGRSLLPLLDGTAPEWRRYLFTEFHTHSAHNYYPQRTVRDDRYKLIHNLMPGEVNPGYDFTMKRFFSGLADGAASAPEPVGEAYRRMRKPPQFELYDLSTDPYEFRNLADDPQHANTLARLRSELERWRRETNDPLLHPENVARLKREIDACFKNGDADTKLLSLSYPEYFFNLPERR